MATAESSGSSKCTRFREKGNALYRQLQGQYVFAAPVRRRKLTQAQQHYTDALSHSHSPEERAACLKNMGVLHVLWTISEIAELSLCRLRMISGVDYLLHALDEGGRAGKPQDWLDHLQGVLLSFVGWAADPETDLCLASPVSLLRCMCEGFDLSLRTYRIKCEAATIAHTRLAEKLFQQGIVKLGDDERETRDFRGCLSAMHQCLQVLRNVEILPANSGEHVKKEHLSKIRDLQVQAQLHIFVCESMHARQTGDEVLKKAVYDEEDINMELVLEAVDYYRSSAVLTRERDIEGEAIAMSRLGHVFSTVIKDGPRASKHHYQATKLALTVMSPRISRSDWYRYSSAEYAKHQAQVVRDEEREHEQQRAPTKKKLEVTLKNLDLERKKDAYSFLVYIYQNHPNPDPKKHPGDMLKPPVKAVTKEMLRKAMSHYHPDVNGQHGEEWQVLCEEISKILNNKYEYFK